MVWKEWRDQIFLYRKPIRSIKELKGSIHAGRDLSKISTEEFIDEELKNGSERGLKVKIYQK